MQKQTKASDLEVLLARSAKGDRAAFAALYQATSSKLWGIVARILPRRDLAEDVLQDVYVKIWEKAGTFDATKASPITWMATIARNRTIDEVRRQPPPSIDDAEELLNMADSGLDPLEQTQQSEALKRLYECLQGLDPERREIVLLAYYAGLSRDELAQKFSRPAGTIKTWLRRSLAQLRKCLGS